MWCVCSRWAAAAFIWLVHTECLRPSETSPPTPTPSPYTHTHTQVHDADFLVTHWSRDVGGLVARLAAGLQARGHLVPPSEGFCRVQSERLAGYEERARADILGDR